MRECLANIRNEKWVKTEILLKAGVIHNSEIDYPQEKDEINPNISVHIAPTKLNIYLPPTFYEDTSKGRPMWWVGNLAHPINSFNSVETL